jgi:hypothetical protein
MNKPEIFTGNNIQQSHIEELQPQGLFELYERIRGDQGLREEVCRLRKVAAMDKSAYQRVKTRLPYFCCALFDKGIRKSENFRSITCFVMDIDKIDSEKIESVKGELRRDPRVKMMFVSPGGHGLKVVFELSGPCTSLKEFSDFYKTFSYHLMEQYSLQSFLDTSTCDATRVCFMSYDEDASYNSMNEQVNLRHFLPDDLFCAPGNDLPGPEAENAAKNDELPEELYKEILHKLNPAAPVRKKTKTIFIPEALNEIQVPITTEFEKLGISVREIRDIHYGKKFIFEVGYRFGEVNLFYGCRGFSVVQSPKSGSDAKLNDIGEMVIRKVLAEGARKESCPVQVSYKLN